MRYSTRWASGVALGAVTLLGGACGGGTLPRTEIPDTDDNREIYDRVLHYRDLMEERNVDGILEMVSRDYYENNGTTETDRDDYGYETLRDEVLPKLRENIQAVQYQVLLRRIEVDDDRARADFEYFYRFKFVEGGEEGWAQKNDFNRLEFKREDGTWKIVAGL